NSYAWPGNVREMINKVKRATIMCDGKRISAQDLELICDGEECSCVLNLRQVRETAERNAILQALETSGYNMAQAARLLGITHPMTLYLPDTCRTTTGSASTRFSSRL